MDQLISLRNATIHFFYSNLLKPVFFAFDPESVHDRMVGTGAMLGSNTFFQKTTSAMFNYSNKKLGQKILGIDFKNPIGLAGGFDKNAQLTNILPDVGFGFMEVGSITGEPCTGNAKPRVWRLKKSKSLVVHIGLKNDGSEAISQKLKSKKFRIPLGTNIAKTNCRETVNTDAGVADYVKAFKKFTDIGDYFTVNISCPNAYGGQPFTDPKRLEKLLTQLDKIKTAKPIFLKLSPDVSEKQIDEILKICAKHRIHGFICTNLTENRKSNKIKDENLPAKGGLSGKVVQELSNNLIAYIYKRACSSEFLNKKTKGKYILVGLGGVFCAEDAYKKIKLGATLVQLITGMIFEGPQLVSEINRGLVKLLEKDGYSNISEAVGKGHNL